MSVKSPQDRIFPVLDAAHVRAALARVGQYNFRSELVRLVTYHRIRTRADELAMRPLVDIDIVRLHLLDDKTLLQVWQQATDGRHGVPPSLVQIIADELDVRPHLLAARDAAQEDGRVGRGLTKP